MKRWRKQNPRAERRLRLIVEMGRRRDKILESPEIDLEALAQLVADYEAADIIYAAADLRRRLEWYRGKETS